MGRKEKDLSILIEGWQAKVIELANEGALLKEITTQIGVKTHYLHSQFNTRFDEYREVFEEAHDICEAWWTRDGRKNLQNKNYNNSLWKFVMGCKFNWNPDAPKGKDGKEIEPAFGEDDAMVDQFKTGGQKNG